MKVKFNFNITAWISGVEIEADSIEEAERKLVAKDIIDLINEGYIENSDLDSIDSEITEADYEVKVYNIIYEIDEADSDDYEFKKRRLITPEQRAAFLAELPREFQTKISDVEVRVDDEELESRIDDEIFRRAGSLLVKSFDYDIISEK